MRIVSFLLMMILAGCAVLPPDSNTPVRLEKSEFSQLSGWGSDNLQSFVGAFKRTCDRINMRDPNAPLGDEIPAGTNGQWQALCQVFAGLDHRDVRVLQFFFEKYFQPYQVTAAGHKEGLFTGYYEAALNGSRTRGGKYQYPLHARPDDLVMVQLGDFRDDLKGRRIAGRVIDGRLQPYEPRADIVAGRWAHDDKVLVWVDDPVDAFFVQIQGSGVVELAEGGEMRIGYAGQNGHPYYAIGRELVARGALEKDEVSMQSIRAWLAANPGASVDVMNSNASYVFFRALDKGPVGGSGVVLTAGRSLAVDHTKLPYGVPMWVDLEAPAGAGAARIQRMMVAQDTGGAIRGAVRGDVFWGHGDSAEQLAGGMKSQGRYWVLLPK